MQEVESIKNTLYKKFGEKIFYYLQQTSFNDLRFLKYYYMKNLNFFFSDNLLTDHIFKNEVILDPIFLKNIFFYYGKYFTKKEKDFLCQKVNQSIYVYVKDQDLPEKGDIMRKHLINRFNFIFPIFFHQSSIDFYSNARSIYRINKKIAKKLKKINDLDFFDKQDKVISSNFNTFILGLKKCDKITFTKKLDYIFDGNNHYYFYGIKVVNYQFILNKWIKMETFDDIYYIILYYTKLRLNKLFYHINKDFIRKIKKKWKLKISKLSKPQLKKLEKLTNYNYDFIYYLFDNIFTK